VELRDIVRGIHPPALDAGLSVALATLAARAPLPAAISIDPGLERYPLDPALQSLAYYCVAELLANVAKHADATGATVEVDCDAEVALRVRVRDDGKGGAMIVGADGSGLRSGLAGLQARVAAVDGQLTVMSPMGGPTVVTVTVPVASQS
jgi:signal transduction histidine kinase